MVTTSRLPALSNAATRITSLWNRKRRKRPNQHRARCLCVETLDRRELMAVDAFQLVAFGPQPVEVRAASPIAAVASTANNSSGLRAVITGADIAASLVAPQVSSASVSTSSVVVDRFDSEPNNTISQADFIGQFGQGSHSRTNYGSTGSGTDTRDYFRFRVDGRTTGSLTLSGMTQDLNFALYNASGSRIASSRNSGTRTDAINLRDLTAGDYYIQVFPGVSNARSAYALRLGLNVS